MARICSMRAVFALSAVPLVSLAVFKQVTSVSPCCVQAEMLWMSADPVLDTKALLAWNQDTAVLSFRGTASWANACSDIRVWTCLPACAHVPCAALQCAPCSPASAGMLWPLHTP